MFNFKASINLRNILEVWEKEQLVSLETTLRLYWKVTRPEINLAMKKLMIHLSTYDTFVQDTRLRPDSKYLESADSFGEYVALNPSKADIIWMPDIFIDQVNHTHMLFLYIRNSSKSNKNNTIVKKRILKSSNRRQNA